MGHNHNCNFIPINLKYQSQSKSIDTKRDMRKCLTLQQLHRLSTLGSLICPKDHQARKFSCQDLHKSHNYKHIHRETEQIWLWKRSRRHIPYHLASSSLVSETALDLAGAGFFLENRATVLNVAGLDANGADDLETALKLRGVPSISDTPKDAILLAQSVNFQALLWFKH